MHAAASVLPQPELAYACAAAIRDAFADYDTRFDEITRRAKSRFEQRDWTGAREDAVARIELYDQCVAEISTALENRLGDRAQDRQLWSAIRDRYGELIAPLLDQELNKTFFNTLTRRFFKTRGVARDIEFIALDIEPTDRITHPVARHNYVVTDGVANLFRRVLADTPFIVAYSDPQRDAAAIAATLQARFPDFDDAGVLGV